MIFLKKLLFYAKINWKAVKILQGFNFVSGNNASLYNKSSKHSSKSSGLSIQSSKSQLKKPPSLPSPKPTSTTSDKVDYKQTLPKSSTPKSTHSSTPTSSIFTSPLSLVSNSTCDKVDKSDRDKAYSGSNTFTTQSLVNSSISSGIPANILR